MATPEQVRTWLHQAEADLAAAQVNAQGIKECHQRYWIQQCFEKALKAYALILFNGSDAEDAALCKLLSHSPMKRLEEHADDPQSNLPNMLERKHLWVLRREVEAFVGSLDNATFLKKIDALEPTHQNDNVSYRYPFMADDGYVAPAAFADWRLHLGDLMGAIAAVKTLVSEVGAAYKGFKRGPK